MVNIPYMVPPESGGSGTQRSSPDPFPLVRVRGKGLAKTIALLARMTSATDGSSSGRAFVTSRLADSGDVRQRHATDKSESDSRRTSIF